MARDEVHIQSQGIEDVSTKNAVRQLERLLKSALDRVAALEAVPAPSGGSGVTLPIAETDVTNLPTDLASKAPLSHSHAEADVTSLTADLAAKALKSTTLTGSGGVLIDGGTAPVDLSANRTISLATGAVTPAISIAISALPASRNLSTAGALDWIYVDSATQPSALAVPTGTSGLRCKQLGSWLWSSFMFVGSVGAYGNYNSGVSLSTTAADDSFGVALSDPSGNGVFATAVGAGFRFRCPAATTSRTATVIAQVTTGTITITATLNNAARTTVTTTLSAAAGVTEQRDIAITYTSDVPCDLCVTVKTTASAGANTSTGLAAITLA